MELFVTTSMDICQKDCYRSCYNIYCSVTADRASSCFAPARHGLQYAERSVGTIYPPFGEQHAPRDKPDAAHRGPDRVRRGGDLCFAPRYRHHPVVGLFFLAANTLLLPIISLVAGTMGEDHLFPPEVKNAARDCTMSSHMLLVLVWTGLVLDIGISTSTVVAGTAREANVDLPNSLVIKAAWLAYLVATNVSFRVTVTGTQFVWSNHYIRLDILILVTLFTKLVFKYGMLFVAKRSLGLGRNPRFIVGYVAQVQPGAHTLAAAAAEAEHPPPLVVRGEDDVHVAETPAGYQMQTNSGERLVTIDRIWRQLDASPLKPSLIEEQKDLCFSFALFKLLRCRFAGYSVSEAGILEAHRFIQRTYIHGARDFARLFRLVKDELAFVHDYHYSSIALPYPHHSLAAASSVLSLCTIGYSVYLVALITAAIDISHRFIELCSCVEAASERHHDIKNIAITRADAAPLFLAIAVLVLCESAELVSYVCSNWTKIGVVCSSYTHRASWRRHHRCIEFLFQHCRLNRLRTTWDQKMQQCTILAPHCPVARSKLSTGLSLIRRFLGMADQSSTRVSRQVKDAIFTAIQRLTTNNQAAPGPGPWVSG